MLSSSQDLLYVVLSLCILWFTVFLCWLLYQAARVLRNANDIIENITHKLEMITDAIEFIRRKVDSLSSSMGTVTGMVVTLAEKFIVNKMNAKMDERRTKRKRSLSTDEDLSEK